jgi:hypothetical protein
MRKSKSLAIGTLGMIMVIGTSALAAEGDGGAAKAKPALQAAQPAAAPAAAGKKDGADAGAAKGAAVEYPTIAMRVPLFTPEFAKTPIATVNGEPILLEDEASAISAVHTGKSEQPTAARQNFADVLDRLINITLMVQEAKNIGLDQLPEVKGNIDGFKKGVLKSLLVKERLKDVKADEKAVDKAYAARYREYNIASVRFKKEADAKKMAQELKAGKKFDDLVDAAVKAKLAEGGTAPSFQQAEKLAPQLAEKLSVTKDGGVTPVIPLQGGFAIVKLYGTRLPEDPQSRERVREQVAVIAKQEALHNYQEELIAKYSKVNEKLVDKLDFEAPKPGFEALLKDKRTIATIQGEQPITVGDLAQALKEKFFHGVELAGKEKKLNPAKHDLLRMMLAKRLVGKEALSKGLDKTDEYKEQVRDYSNSIIFGTFVEKVIRPEVKLTEADVRKYHEAHRADYTYPATVKLNGLVFSKESAAQAAVTKLRNGVDFKWLKSTAEAQLPADAPDTIQFDAEPMQVNSLPEDLNKALAGVKSGDARYYNDGAGHFYALQVLEYVPGREMTFDEAKQAIAPKLYNEKLQKNIDEWTKKLRTGSDIKIYADFGK